VPAGVDLQPDRGAAVPEHDPGDSLAMLELKKQVLAPVRVGDTVHGEIEVVSVRPTSKGKSRIVLSKSREEPATTRS